MLEFPEGIFSNLTATETMGVVELLHYATLAKIREDFEVLLNVFRKVFGFRHVMGGVINLSDIGISEAIEWKASEIRHHLTKGTFPDEWIEEYYTGKYYRYDKVLHLLQEGHFAHTWDELLAKCTTASERMVFDGAKIYGLYPGLTVGHTDMGLGWGSFISCAGCGEGDDKRLLPLVDYVLGTMHGDFVATLASGMKNDKPKNGLNFPASSREKEIAYWICEGKTNPEIAEILGVKDRTVRYYMAILFEKFGVHNRSLLMKELLSQSWFSSNESQGSS